MESSLVISHVITDPVTSQTHTKFYTKGRLLGKGGFAYCYEVTSLDSKRKYACKIIPKSRLKRKSSRLKLVTEIKIHRFVSLHHNIVRFVKWFEDLNNVFILMELCKHKSLLELLNSRGKLSENEVRYFMAQILSGVRFLHSSNVIHRDLKLGNILISNDYKLKIGDFGLATKLETKSQRKMTLCGTPNYIAPEVLFHDKKGHSFEVDVWSLGVIMYTLLVGIPPFEAPDIKLTYERIKECFFNFPAQAKLSRECKDLIRIILSNDPTSRPTLKEIRFHSFFTSHKIPRSLPPETQNTKPTITEFRESFSASALSMDNLSKPSKSLGQFEEETLSPSYNNNNNNNENNNNSNNEKKKKKKRILRVQCPNSETSPRLERRKDQKRKALLNSEQLCVHCSPFKGGQQPLKRKPSSSSPLSAAVKERTERTAETITKSKHLEKEKEKDISAKVKMPLNFLWATCWIDYTSKYGLGYSLSDGTHGFCFNDGSKMVLSPDKTNIEYIQQESFRANAEELYYSILPGVNSVNYTHNPRHIVETGQKFPFSTPKKFPAKLVKKVTLLRHFAEYLEKSKDYTQESALEESLCDSKFRVHVCRWTKSRSARVFMFSNGAFQLNFSDNSEIIVIPCQAVPRSDRIFAERFYETKSIITFTDKKGCRENWGFEEALASANSSLRKRAKYSLDIIAKMAKYFVNTILIEKI